MIILVGSVIRFLLCYSLLCFQPRSLPLLLRADLVIYFCSISSPQKTFRSVLYTFRLSTISFLVSSLTDHLTPVFAGCCKPVISWFRSSFFCPLAFSFHCSNISSYVVVWSVQGTEPRTLCMLGMCSTTEVYSSSSNVYLLKNENSFQKTFSLSHLSLKLLT